MSWKEVGDWAFYGAAVAAITFVLLYLIFAPWWQTPTGRNIIAVMGSMAVAFGYFAWVIHLGGVPGSFYPMRALIFSGIALSISWRVWMLIRTQILKRRQDELEDAR